jgi:hypothetical protein
MTKCPIFLHFLPVQIHATLHPLGHLHPPDAHFAFVHTEKRTHFFFFTPLRIPGVDLYYTRPTLGFSLSFSKHQSNLGQSHKGRHRDAWTELIKGYLIASASSIFWTFCLVKLLITIFSIFIINQEQFTKLLKISMQAAVYFCYLKD